jgi:predicted ABC-type ATPase
MPDILVFGGCNGSGKTTIANTILSTFSNVEFVNADLIAAQLNPNNVDVAAIQASRLMIERLNTLSKQRANFAFETTLAARTFAKFLRDCQTEGYRINLIYVWLENIELAINRVRKRIESGGHDIPVEVIRRRYEGGRKNLIQLYLPLADRFQAYDNSTTNNSLIAYRVNLEQEVVIIEQDKWNQIINS